MRHAIRSWWRYSRISASFTTAVVMLLLAATVLTVELDHKWLTLVVASAASLLVQLVRGAVMAERARRHGCW